MKRFSLFWELITADQTVPDKVFKKLFNFSLGVSILFALAYVEPAALVVLVLALSPYLAILAMTLIISLMVSVLWYWWQEAGRLRKKDIDTLDEE